MPWRRCARVLFAAAAAEQARARIEAAFRRTASALCVAGTLSVATFLGFDRVVLSHAEGAMEPTLYPGHTPRTLIYELFDIYRALGKSAECGGCIRLFVEQMRGDANFAVPAELRDLGRVPRLRQEA